jgi:hypothetical protein
MQEGCSLALFAWIRHRWCRTRPAQRCRISRLQLLHPSLEMTRKFVHLGTGLICLAFPSLFTTAWSLVALIAVFAPQPMDSPRLHGDPPQSGRQGSRFRGRTDFVFGGLPRLRGGGPLAPARVRLRFPSRDRTSRLRRSRVPGHFLVGAAVPCIAPGRSGPVGQVASTRSRRGASRVPVRRSRLVLDPGRPLPESLGNSRVPRLRGLHLRMSWLPLEQEGPRNGSWYSLRPGGTDVLAQRLRPGSPLDASKLRALAFTQSVASLLVWGIWRWLSA